MTDYSYKVFYFIKLDPSIAQGYFNFSLIPPLESTVVFTCRLENSDGSPIDNIIATTQMVVSKTYSTDTVKTNTLVAKLNYAESGVSDTVLTIMLPQDYHTSLNQSNIEFDYVRIPTDVCEIKNLTEDGNNTAVTSSAVDSEPPVSYFTGFEQTGPNYFLSYIEWLDWPFSLFFAPPKQTEKNTASGKNCCLLYENYQSGTGTVLKSKQLPVPRNTTEASLSFTTYFLLSQASLTVTLIIDGKQATQSSITPFSVEAFQTNVVSCEIPDGAKNFLFIIQMEPLRYIIFNNFCFLDDLALNFVERKTTFDYGAVMNGIDTSIAVPSINADSIQGDFTVEACFKPAMVGGTLISGKYAIYDNYYGYGCFLLQLNPDGKFRFAENNYYGIVEFNTVSTLAFDGNWHHIAGVKKDGGLTVYFDGNPLDASWRRSLPKAITRNNTAITIGATEQELEQNKHFGGIISEVRCWTLARTPEEIKEYMFQCLTGNEPQLLGYWPLTDKSAIDMTLLHNNGQISGPVTFDGPSEDLLMIGVAKNSVAGSERIGDHTFVYAIDPRLSAPYPNNVVCWFNCAGQHANEPNVPVTLNILNVRASLSDLVNMSIDTPVTTPFKKEYGGEGFFKTETCGIDPTGFKSKTGWCHQITNRLLYASSWPNRIVTLGDCPKNLAPTGYWLSVFLTGVYGSSYNYYRRYYGLEINFSDWCEKRGFPKPPSDTEALLIECLKVTSDVRKVDKWLNYVYEFMTWQGPDKTPQENQEYTDALKQNLKNTLNTEEFLKLDL